ncbi:acetylglutamate kinase [Halobacteriales archaeon QS_8_69_26]|nr:MAG: acetylglutamate kinase [Halobacteriales archaeon QS_8_69_26]
MIVVKLGGSVMTRKEEPETVDHGALDRAAVAVAGAVEAGADVVVVHGGGSFGHHHAERHGVTDTAGTHDPAALLDVHGAMKRLNDAVVEALVAHDVGAAPVHPFSVAHRDRDGDPTFPSGGIATMVAEGFVPVLHGDGVPHRGEGVTVLSGDEIVVELARSLSADRVGLCSTVPGVLRDGEVIDEIRSYDEVADVLGGSDATDVTGGMAGKVRQLLALSAPATVFGLDDLEGFLAGERVGTVIRGGDD